MTKILNHLFAFTIIFISFGCSNQDTQIISDPQSKTRSVDCALCDNLSYDIQYKPLSSTCCVAYVTVKSSNPVKECGQKVFIDGNFKQTISEALTVFEIPICELNTVVFRVNGWDDTTNDYTKICKEQRLTCAPCCNDVSYERFTCPSPNDQCCNFQYKFANQSSCQMYVFDEVGSVVSTIPTAGQSYASIQVCGGQARKFTIGQSVDDQCKTVEILPDCGASCTCGASTIVAKSLLTNTLKGCCGYNVTATNKSNCTKYVYDSKGIVHATLAPGQKITIKIQTCDNLYVYIGNYSDINACNAVCAQVRVGCKK